ncbi:MAG TPA: STAS domain-containing protein [Thermoleophilaceae bacterium]|nr:STAS domain-containing protein [Thermoleophilaceae bacterium]
MATREFEVAVRERDGTPVIELVGDVDATAGEALEAGYAEAVADCPAAVALDFARAEYINSSGIAVIVGLLALARSTGIEIKAYGLSDHYREIFEITRLADFMTIEGDRDD